MTSQAVSGIGTIFKRWDDSASVGVWATIAEIISISGPGMSRETIDVTSFDSTGGYREFIGSLRDGGSIELSMIFRRDTYEIMKDDFEDDTLQNYQILLPDDDATALDFEGLITELPMNIAMDDKIMTDISIKISGQITLSSGGLSSIA
jgi:predicted secreted protein